MCLPVFPGAWVPTPAAFSNAVGPRYWNCKALPGIDPGCNCSSVSVYLFRRPGSDFYEMVKEVYDISKTLTEEQKAIARFWADVGGPGRGYPVPGHFISIVTQVLEKQGTDLGRSAEIYAKTSIAIRDAMINTWKLKFEYNIIRPVTYINKVIDPSWTTLVPTPPYPEYPSALTYILGSVMQVLIREIGDNVPVTDNTYTFNGSTARQYTSFTKMAEEGAISRFYGGIHYKIVVEMSLPLAKRLGDKVADIKLRP
jgi:hypothetical protein